MHNKAAKDPERAQTNPLANLNVQIKCANKLHPVVETGLWIIAFFSWVFIVCQIVQALTVSFR